MAKSKFQNGDLVSVELTEHSEIPKKWAVFGQFKGSRKKVILARIGEGEDDPRDPEVVKLTAEHVCKYIVDLYATMAMLRHHS